MCATSRPLSVGEQRRSRCKLPVSGLLGVTLVPGALLALLALLAASSGPTGPTHQAPSPFRGAGSGRRLYDWEIPGIEAPPQHGQGGEVALSDASESHGGDPSEAGLEHGDSSHSLGNNHKTSKADVASLTAAFMLMGTVVFVMSLFYLVNCSDSDIRDTSWQLVSATTSIFIALLLFEALDKVLAHWVGDCWLLSFFIFLGCWAAYQSCLYAFMGDRLRMRALGTIGAHVTGFSAIHAFEDIQQRQSPFKDTMALGFVVILIYGCCILVLSWISGRIRDRLNYRDEVVDEEESEWDEVCEECENDVTAICIGKLFCNSVRFELLGYIPPEEIILCEHCALPTKAQVSHFFIIALFLLVASLVATALEQSWRSREWIRHWHRHVKLAQCTIAMSMSWTLLFSSQWVFKLVHPSNLVLQSPMLRLLVLAVELGVASMVVIFLLDFLADRGCLDPRGLRNIIVALGVLIGLSWETTFDLAIESLAEGLTTDGSTSPEEVMVQAGIQMALAAICYPAWSLYILPKTYAASGKEKERTETGQKTHERGLWRYGICCGVPPMTGEEEEEEEEGLLETDREVASTVIPLAYKEKQLLMTPFRDRF